MIRDIRDDRVRELVIERLRERGIDPNEEGLKRIPQNVLDPPLRMVARGQKPTENDPVINKVRVLTKDKTIKLIRESSAQEAFVKPENNHHVCLFELPGHSPDKPERVLDVVTTLTAIQRVKKRSRRGKAQRDKGVVTPLETIQPVQNVEPIIQRKHPDYPDARFLFSLSEGEMFLFDGPGDAATNLHTFRFASAGNYQMTFSPHTDARPAKDRRAKRAQPNTLNGRKVLVDILGRLHDAND
jgi:hypothetical protein